MWSAPDGLNADGLFPTNRHGGEPGAGDASVAGTIFIEPLHIAPPVTPAG